MSDTIKQEQILTNAAVKKFRGIVYRYFKKYGRDLPWRATQNPYYILVSEIMLQQTQVQKVLEKYKWFIYTFPDIFSLARATLQEVLNEWQGLGYNRRAIALKQIARRVVDEFHGTIPSSAETLRTFPGIGNATASAIAAFAFQKPEVFIETNIRRVFIHCFFQDKDDIKDIEILPFVARTLDTANPRAWYYALMDYGVLLKSDHENPNRRSAHYQKQAPFQGSNRQIRGMILKVITQESYLSEHEIIQRLQVCPEKLRNNLSRLEREGFLKKKKRKFTIA
ncbi:MAG: A/G-specific adenine glycosylase [Candidatus Loosdrechtia sp.]|uniref:A/G-specific adenine glycosylase n=1 Tax=Candidatus Loosdrechtia sp. TaxID=3101272 RepID=UPI003A63E4D1|nr:MAG: A/G-specific adenine glycosylase [Candidatus Jettenia sp. AMX2]